MSQRLRVILLHALPLAYMTPRLYCAFDSLIDQWTKKAKGGHVVGLQRCPFTIRVNEDDVRVIASTTTKAPQAQPSLPIAG